MTDTADLQGEEAASPSTRDPKRLAFLLIPVIVVIGGIAMWLSWPVSEEIIEEAPAELEDIPAAKAPMIVPPSSESAIDVPALSDASANDDPADAGPPYIPPTTTDVPTTSETLDVPVIDPFQTTPYDERRSRLQDALNASPVIEVMVIEEDADLDSGTRADTATHDGSHTLTPGAVIPSVLLQGINTDLPGIAVAQVSRDVYDSRTGTELLIPRGSRVFGTYGSEPLVSNQRVLVSWERIDLPNGKVIDLAKVIGSDQSGNAGLQDQVHRRTGKALGITGLTSLITAGLTYAANRNDPAVLQQSSEGGLVLEPSYSVEATSAVAQQYGDIVSQIAQRHLEQGPTITIRPGYQFAIQIAEEITLRPYLP